MNTKLVNSYEEKGLKMNYDKIKYLTVVGEDGNEHML
jgi:hypothetical protein